MIGNKYLTPHYPNQGNCLYMKRTPSKTHNLIQKGNNISIPDQKRKKKKKTFLGDTWSLFGPVTSWVDWQVLSET